MIRPRSLRAQITLASCLLVVIVVALSGLAIAIRIDKQDRDQVDQGLEARAAKVVAESVEPATDAKSSSETTKPAEENDLLAGSESLTRLLIGTTVVEQRGESLEGGIPGADADGLSTMTIEGQKWRSLVVAAGPEPERRVQVLQSLEPVEARLADNRRLIVIVAALASALTGAGAWLLSGLLLRPLSRLRDAALSIHAGSGDQQLPTPNSPAEVAELSATLNGMLERLQRSMEATKRFTADAGHELRTPLTGLGADLETLRRNPGISADKREEMLEAMGAEHQRIVRLLDGLQSLARGDSEVLPGREAVEVSEILREAVIAARRRYPRVTFQLTPPSEPAVLECWSDGLRLAIDNLLSNAAIHGKPDGLVEASVEVTEETMVLAVADDGPGVDASLRQRVVSRFSRGPEPRGCGSGLGLSIVEQQARLLEGALSLGESDAGGLSAQITLPRGNQPSSGKS